MNRKLLVFALVVALLASSAAAQVPANQTPATPQTQEPSQASAEASQPATGTHLALPDVNEIMRRAVDKDIVNWEAAKDYTFLERTQEDKLDKGRVQSSKVETREIYILYGEPFEKLVAKDGKPLSPDEQKKQDEKFQNETRKRENETPEERKKRLEKFEKERQDARAFVREVLDAYNFRLVSQEVLDSRKVWVIDADPRPGFQAKRKEARILPKIKPRFWIDQQDYQWVKLHGDVLDTISWGWVLARLHRGTTFDLQQMRVNNEVWLPKRVDVRLDARIGLVKGINEDVHVTYSEYKKFRAESKIVPIEGGANP